MERTIIDDGPSLKEILDVANTICPKKDALTLAFSVRTGSVTSDHLPPRCIVSGTISVSFLKLRHEDDSKIGIEARLNGATIIIHYNPIMRTGYIDGALTPRK